MHDVLVHFRGAGTKRVKMPTIPPPGAYLCDAGRLWRVDCVVFGQRTNVYVIGVGGVVAAELEQAWGSWSIPNDA
jgi:hypothetical protein